MSQPKYVATIKVGKVTPARGAVGFSNEVPQDATREEITSIRVTDGDLSQLPGKLRRHIDIIWEEKDAQD